MTVSVSHWKLRLFVVVIAMFFLWQAIKLLPWLLAIQEASGDSLQARTGEVAPVLVTVFYEALCPDSKSFVTKQLLPTFEKAPRLVAVNLVPYGKAKASWLSHAVRTVEDGFGNISFSCQHGPVECQANKIHACAIDYLSDMGLLLRYIACMISDNMNPEYIAGECAKKLSFDVGPILKCSKSRKGSELLKDFGVRTSELSSLSFVPTVLLNNELGKQTSILKNLFEEVCGMYDSPPTECINRRSSLYR